MPKRQVVVEGDISEGERKGVAHAKPFLWKPLTGMIFALALAAAIVALEFGVLK